jgi:hypothetical protein
VDTASQIVTAEAAMVAAGAAIRIQGQGSRCHGFAE